VAATDVDFFTTVLLVPWPCSKTTELQELRSDACWRHATVGFGNMLARPLFREKHRPDISETEAMELMREALKVRRYP